MSSPSHQWKAVVLRFSAFPVGSFDVPSTGWWESLMNEEPEDKQYKPRTHELQESGEYASGRLIITATPAFVHLQLLKVADVGEDNVLTSFGPFSEAVNLLMPVAFGWLHQHHSDLQRIAFGTQVFLPAESKAAAFSQLAPFIPVKIDPNNTNDFLYQINRYRTSTTMPDLVLNRVSKWFSLNYNFEGQIDNPSTRQVIALPGLGGYVTFLELDINTSAEFTDPLPHESLEALFTELVALGLEIADKGDVA